MWRFYGAALVLCIWRAAVFAQEPPPPPPHAILLAQTALVPVRALAAGVGAAVETTPATVTLTRGDIRLTLTPFSTAATAGERALALPAPPILRDHLLYVPARAVAAVFGATVGWSGDPPDAAAKSLTVTYRDATTPFRMVEEARWLRADFTGDGQVEAAVAVANVPGIDAYNSRYASDIVDVTLMVARGTRVRWQRTLARGASLARFAAQELTGDRAAELLVTYLTRHSYMGPYPGSIYTFNAFRASGQGFAAILALDYSRDHGHLYLEPATRQPAAFILVDTNWRRNEDINRYIAERYTWDGTRYLLARRVVTRENIASLAAARRLLR